MQNGSISICTWIMYNTSSISFPHHLTNLIRANCSFPPLCMGSISIPPSIYWIEQCPPLSFEIVQLTLNIYFLLNTNSPNLLIRIKKKKKKKNLKMLIRMLDLLANILTSLCFPLHSRGQQENGRTLIGEEFITMPS